MIARYYVLIGLLSNSTFPPIAILYSILIFNLHRKRYTAKLNVDPSSVDRTSFNRGCPTKLRVCPSADNKQMMCPLYSTQYSCTIDTNRAILVVGRDAGTSAEKALLCTRSSTLMLRIPYSTLSSTPYTGNLKGKELRTICHSPIPQHRKEGRLGLLCTPDTSFYSPPL